MDLKEPKTMVIGTAAIVAVIVAVVFIWNQLQAMAPNAIYRNAKSPEESRRAFQETQQKYQTTQDRFQRMKRSGSGGSTTATP